MSNFARFCPNFAGILPELAEVFFSWNFVQKSEKQKMKMEKENEYDTRRTSGNVGRMLAEVLPICVGITANISTNA